MIGLKKKLNLHKLNKKKLLKLLNKQHKKKPKEMLKKKLKEKLKKRPRKKLNKMLNKRLNKKRKNLNKLRPIQPANKAETILKLQRKLKNLKHQRKSLSK